MKNNPFHFRITSKECRAATTQANQAIRMVRWIFLKTTFITGASSGLSRRFAYTLAKVIIVARNLERLQLVAKEIQSQGGQTLAFQMDVTSKESIQSVMEKITNQGKKIDIFINNAGTTKWTPLFPGSIEDDTFEKRGLEVWDELMNLNLRGLWMITQVIAEYMRSISKDQ